MRCVAGLARAAHVVDRLACGFLVLLVRSGAKRFGGFGVLFGQAVPVFLLALLGFVLAQVDRARFQFLGKFAQVGPLLVIDRRLGLGQERIVALVRLAHDLLD